MIPYLRVRELQSRDREDDFARGDHEVLRDEPEHVDRVLARQDEVGQGLLVADLGVSSHIERSDSSLSDVQCPHGVLARVDTILICSWINSDQDSITIISENSQKKYAHS